MRACCCVTMPNDVPCPKCRDGLHGLCHIRYSQSEAAATKTDVVNHPPHYGGHPSGVECITVVEHMSFNVGNAIKYLWRHQEKGDPIQDLKKARWYVDREIQRLQVQEKGIHSNE